MTVNIYANSSGDSIDSEELKLYNLINQYRNQNNLPSIPISKALSIVGNRHVLDLAENIGSLTHGWSDAPYDANNPSTYSAIWDAPKRFNTGYQGYGYENAFGGSGGYVATANDAFNAWKNSAPHNATILNQGIWQTSKWNALGVAIYKGYAVIWFGEEFESPNIPLATLKQNPSTYMDAIRDYDGNNLGSASSWKVAGNDVDVQGDGDLETILFNSEIGRWASVGTVNGVVDFTKNGLNGDTRVVGIYIDPTLKSQPQNIGGPFDSQRRFQNDLRINNLSVLAAADYDKDGFQEVYFKVNDGSSVLHGLMHKDGNIQYANYQSKSDLTSFMNANNVSSSIWGSWI
jgi:uncharacterized protein YkwD